VTDEVPKNLKSTALWALRLVAAILAEGYTGIIEVHCCQGGVSMVKKPEVLKPPKE